MRWFQLHCWWPHLYHTRLLRLPIDHLLVPKQEYLRFLTCQLNLHQIELKWNLRYPLKKLLNFLLFFALVLLTYAPWPVGMAVLLSLLMCHCYQDTLLIPAQASMGYNLLSIHICKVANPPLKLWGASGTLYLIQPLLPRVLLQIPLFWVLLMNTFWPCAGSNLLMISAVLTDPTSALFL